MADKPFVHPYIPNSVPETKQAMLDELGLSSVEEIYAEIPDRLRFKGTLDIPPAILSERQLRKHVQGLLDKNTSSVDFLNFCGAGCWQHHVPSVVDEIINRAEFVSAYCGGDYSDLGKYLTRYEFNSMLGELLDYDAVANPIYDWGDVAGRSFRMARRITGRDTVLVPAHMSPMRLMEARTLCQPESMANSTKIRFYEWDRETGMVDLEDLKAKLDDSYAAVYWESPGYLGTIEANGAEIVKLAHAVGALAINGVDPITLGVLAPPGAIGADIACGDIQPLGMHMHAGGGCSGLHRLQGRRPGLRPGVPARALHRHGDRHARPVRRGRGDGRPHQLRRPRPGQGLGRHGVGPVDHRRRRLHGAHGPAGLQGGRRDLHRPLALRGQEARRAAGRARSSSRRASSRSSSSTSTAPARPWPRSTRRCSATRSSAARTSRPSSPSSARARSTASPSTTTRPTSTRWSRPSRR